jgi:hypothetical protein
MPKPGPRTTYRYTDQFKATAVRLRQLPSAVARTLPHRFTSFVHAVSLAQTSARGFDDGERYAARKGRHRMP